MAEPYSQEELNEAYFIQLVYTFQAAAMQQMGKITNPMTGKIEKNMEQAKHSIDMLAMLETKTGGNLTDRERRTLEKSLFELRMNYVDEMKLTGEVEKKGSQEQQEQDGQAEQASPEGGEQKPEKPSEEDGSGEKKQQSEKN